VLLHLESKPLRDPLDGKVAKPLKFKFVHNLNFFYHGLHRFHRFSF
jgi:hypothetical protein